MNKLTYVLVMILLAGTVWSLERPNVVLIVCDDLNDYITGIPGETGHPQSLTPHVEKLARSGVAFRRAYSNNPVCAPSRSSFLTGIYPQTSLNLFWDKWYENPVLQNSKTIMEYFHENGYQIAGSGKLMHHLWRPAWNGGEYKYKADYGPYWFDGEKRWSNPWVPEPFASIGPIDGSFGPLKPVPEGQPDGAGWKNGWGREKLLDFSDPEQRDLTPDEINAEWAVKKINQYARKADDKPFFLAVGFVRPHTPLHVPQEYFDRFPLDDLKLPPLKGGDNNDTGFTSELFPESKGLKYFKLLKESFPSEQEGLKAFVQAYLASVAAVDECIGQVVDALDQTRLKNNTILVLTSDHGWNMGGKDFLFKNSLWEESTRVPMVILAPGVAKTGGVAEHPVSLIDLYPTLADLCELQGDTRKNSKGAQLDGFSMRPFLENPESRIWDGPDGALTMIFSGGNYFPEYGKDAAMQHWALRTERYRYIRYNDGFEELYDHKKDPNEWTNQAANPEYAAIKQELNERLMARLPSKEESARKAKNFREADAERWKAEYFKKHQDADSNKDGDLSWSEYKNHKKQRDAENMRIQDDG